MLSTCVLSVVWNGVGRGCLHHQPPIKTLSTEHLMSLPGRHRFIHMVTPLRGISTRCVTLQGGLGKLELGLLQTSSHTSLFYGWVSFVSFLCDKSYHEYNCMSSVSVARESPAWREVGLGNPWHRVWPCWLPQSGHGIRSSPLTAQFLIEVGWNGLLASGDLQPL